MNKGRLLWILVLADLLLSFASVGSEAFFYWMLPPALLAYQHSHDSGFSFNGVSDVLQLAVLCVTCLTAFASWIGLVTYWRYARELYLVACVFWMLDILSERAIVMPSVSLAFRVLNGLVGGMIIALVYFTELAQKFERRAVQSPAAAQLT